MVDSKKMYQDYHIINETRLHDVDVIILVVPHKTYIDNLDNILQMYKNNIDKRMLFDLYNVIDINNDTDLKIERI